METLKKSKLERIPNTVTAIEQRISFLLAQEAEDKLLPHEKTELAELRENPVVKDEYTNVLNARNFSQLPKKERVQLTRQEIDKKILGDAA